MKTKQFERTGVQKLGMFLAQTRRRAQEKVMTTQKWEKWHEQENIIVTRKLWKGLVRAVQHTIRENWAILE